MSKRILPLKIGKMEVAAGNDQLLTPNASTQQRDLRFPGPASGAIRVESGRRSNARSRFGSRGCIDKFKDR